MGSVSHVNDVWVKKPGPRSLVLCTVNLFSFFFFFFFFFDVHAVHDGFENLTKNSTYNIQGFP